MYKVDSARLFRDAARSNRNATGAATGILAGLTVIAAYVAVANDLSTGPVIAFVALLMLWLRSARRYQKSGVELAKRESKLIKEQDLFEARLHRKMEW